MKNFSIIGVLAALAVFLAFTGCAGVSTYSELPPDPAPGIAAAPLAASPDEGRAPQEPYVADEGESDAEYYEDDEKNGEDKEGEDGEEDGFPFDKVGRIEVSFDALYRERNEHGSDSESQEILLAPEIGVIVHKNFEALAGIGIYWLRGGEKDLPLYPVVTGGTVLGHYRIEERYLQIGGRANLPLPELKMFVPFAELKLGIATHAEWNRIVSKHDWGLSNTLAFGTRIFLCDDRKAALTVKLNIHHVDWDEDEIIIGSRALKELLFGFSFFF